jgi:hypothetical protein
MGSNPKDVFKAVTAIGSALEGMDAEAQRRVLDGVARVLGLDRSRLGGHTDETSKGDGNGTTTPSQVGGRGGKPLSVVEFVKESKASTNPQFIAAFAAYRQQVEGTEHFSAAQLRPYFAKAREPDPKKNFQRDYGRAVANGWIHDAGDKSYLTTTGEEAVAGHFASTGKSRSGPAPAKKKSGAKKD